MDRKEAENIAEQMDELRALEDVARFIADRATEISEGEDDSDEPHTATLLALIGESNAFDAPVDAPRIGEDLAGKLVDELRRIASTRIAEIKQSLQLTETEQQAAA